MKEDVLEQIVDDYLQMKGYFTTHNVRFKPPRDSEFVVAKDSVPSDIDVVGLNPRRDGPERVMVVSCKSWQSGFRATRLLAQLRGEVPNPKRPVELHFRELWLKRWADGFRKRIEELTGSSRFTYCIAVTWATGDTDAWSKDPRIQENLDYNPLQFLTLQKMWATVLKEVTTTPASSEIGRLAQLLKAAGLTASTQVAPLSALGVTPDSIPIDE